METACALPSPMARTAQDDTVLARDRRLIDRVTRRDVSAQTKSIAIVRHAHEPSEHVLNLNTQARRVVTHMREATAATIREWMAPYDPPPSVEQFASLTQDLYVESVDPRTFREQFTPGNPDTAFHERYHWWSKIRSPFIRWEAEQSGAQTREESINPTVESTASPQPSSLDSARDRPPRGEGETGIVTYAHRLLALGRLARDVAHRMREGVSVAVEDIRDQEKDMIEQVEQAWKVPMLVPRVDAVRVMAGLFVLLFVVSIPAGAVSLSRSFGSSVRQVIQHGEQGVVEARSAVRQSGNEQAAAFGRASARFAEAGSALDRANALALAVVQTMPQTRDLFGSAQGMLRAGEKSSQAAELLAKGVALALAEHTIHPDERLLTLRTYLASAQPLLDEARAAVAGARTDRLPADARVQMEALRSALAFGQASLRDLRAMLDLLIDAVGHDRPRTYLVVFQNQTELRPTGGFMGSLAEVTFDRGAIKKIFVPGGGPYDFRNQLLARVAPPKPLRLVGGRWEFQDANWFPDFPAAAQKIRWFWSKAGQPTLDGVMTVNETVMEKLLRIAGPIEMPEYGKIVTADTFLLETQKQVELEYDRMENKPKKFIGDLMPRMLERLRSGSRDEWLQYLAVMTESLENKDIQMAFADRESDALASRFRWRGEIKPDKGDYLAVVEANIAGQKTDAVIDEEVQQDVRIAEDGTIEETVTVTRTHRGQRGELFRGANNVAYLRVYVPQGSVLMDADGFDAPSSTYFETPLRGDPEDPDVERMVSREREEVSGVMTTDEFGATAFGGWVQLPPGQTRVTRFRYRLPFTAFEMARRYADSPERASGQAGYVLSLVSQSGKTSRLIRTRMSVPPSWRMTWTNGSEQSPSEAFAGALDRDVVVAQWFDVPASSYETPNVTTR